MTIGEKEIFEDLLRRNLELNSVSMKNLLMFVWLNMKAAQERQSRNCCRR